MGTSSILAGAACAVIGRITGKNYSEKELIDLVLKVEKEMSTNGGWQDQVGGLIAGVKYTNSPAVKDEEPIRVYPKQLLVTDDKLNKLCSRMALIFTGETRLAKNVLQNVIKQWENGEDRIKENVQELKQNANECAEALIQGNITKLAECLNKYREQKSIMAPDSEPEEVRDCYKILNKHECAGYCLVGAGGGGYLVVITKEGKTVEELRKLVSPKYEVNKIQIDNEGLVFTSHADWVEETKKLTQD
ncbi:L-fucose kinase-like isoform X2 [Xenia sp. Carnegie-2017]|uniref:L-fucose kinase-like isoform X2 n=1 Tax=Xenia sp. Carnegie-2017 TaxID=2897299 RepID=UPI001F041D3E|nr:L-fucose kinase-like isoform X2 [Xenia sp. Carnegie-2017]